jgi:radical SAM superfamily enzyme
MKDKTLFFCPSQEGTLRRGAWTWCKEKEPQPKKTVFKS